MGGGYVYGYASRHDERCNYSGAVPGWNHKEINNCIIFTTTKIIGLLTYRGGGRTIENMYKK